VTGCDTVYKRKVLIAPKAVPNAKLPTALCEKTDLIFESTSTVSSGSIEYEWDFGDGTPTTTEASPSHNYATFGQYTITLKTTTNPHGFTTTKTMLVDITEVPVATIINTNACEGTAVKLKNATVYGGSGNIQYSWDYGDGSAVYVTSSSADLFKNYSTPGGYKVTLSATADGCSNSVTKVVYQFAKPVASFAQVSGNCLNTEFKFENNSTISLGQFGSLWDFDDAGNKATVNEPVYNFTTAGTKNVKLEVVSEFGCTDTRIIPVEVKQIPTTDYTYPFACSRTATPFTNTTNLNGETLQSYFWNFGDGFTSSATSPLKSWTTIGPRMVSLTTYLMNGCSTTETKEVSVGVQPLVNFSVEDRCAGSDVPFANLTTYSQGTIQYTWNFGDGSTLDASASYFWQDVGYSNVFNMWATKIPQWDQVDARLSWTSSDGMFTVIGYVRNLMDEIQYDSRGGGRRISNGRRDPAGLAMCGSTPATSITFSPTTPTGFLGEDCLTITDTYRPPRTAGVELQIRF
jgi:PKD repeat protein